MTATEPGAPDYHESPTPPPVQLTNDGRSLHDLERENAFLKAGVDTTTPIGQLLLDGYKGDLTPEAIKLRAEAVGALTTEPAPVPATDPSPELGERQIMAGDGTVTPSDAPKPHPHNVAREIVTKAKMDGEREVDAIAQGFHSLASAAASGDGRAIIRPT